MGVFCGACGGALVDGARFCPECGRPLPPVESEARLYAPAMAPAASTPPPRPSATPSWSATPAVPPTAAQPEQPEVWSAGSGSGAADMHPRSARRSVKPRLLALVAGVSVLGLIGYLVISGMLGRGAAGAGSPEDAVKGLVTALQSKDVAAVAAALDPNEARQLVPFVNQVQDTAEAGGVTKKGQEPAGVDVEITGGKITVAGIDKSKLPLALNGLTVDPSSNSMDLGKLDVERNLRPFVMVVKEDRGWFVSPLFTGAELLAQRQGVLGSYADALPPTTTEKTADEAVTQFLRAVASKNPDAVLARLAPQEQSVARTYDRLWRPDLTQAMGSDAWNATSLRVSIGKMTDTKLGDGSTGVVIESADVAVSDNNGLANYSLEKDCIQGSGISAQCLKSWVSGTAGVSDIAQQGGTSARATIVAVKTGDGYAVSLVGTAAATSRRGLAALDAKQVFRAFGMDFLLPTGGSLGVGQQLSVDASSTDNVTLTVDHQANVVLEAGQGDVSVQPWNASGRPVDSSWDGSSTASYYSLKPGQYRITWSKNSIPNNRNCLLYTSDAADE